MAASEMAPFVRTGELADAVADQARELRRLGHEVSVVLPYFRSVREGKTVKAKKSRAKFSVQVGASRMPCEIYEAKTPEGVQVYFVARDEYFDRSGLYGADDRDYQDNAARFIYFTKCALEFARRMEPMPDILQAFSWETALLPVFSRDQRLPFRTVLTPLSLEYQGNFWSYDFGLTNLPEEYFGARGVEYYGSMNCLKGGILYADAVVLSSEREVFEAQTPLHGCGMENVLREHQHKLCGIPSPAGVEGWKTIKRDKARAALLEKLELEPGAARGVIALVSDATAGAGLAGLFEALDRLLADDVRVALLGSVQPGDIFALEVARRAHRGRFVQVDQYDDELARLTLAGSDLFLVPGPVEPRAVWLRRAMLSGAVPVAAQCGGLFQFVRDWEPGRGAGNGFAFSTPTPDGLLDSCRRALDVLGDEQARQTLRARCEAMNFSHAAMAEGYQALYERLLGRAPSVRAA